MPGKVPRQCRVPGCPGKATDRSGYCDAHIKTERWSYDKQRGSAAARGYDVRWQRARIQYLREHPICVECWKEGRATAATVVDHIKPHRGDQELFWDQKNWQALCATHHNIKTGKGK